MFFIKKSGLLTAKNAVKAFICRYKIPMWISVNLTNRCQRHCKFCGIWKRTDDEMATKQIFSLVDEITWLGTRVINFTGGEPLIRDDLVQIINYAKSKGLKVSLSSSGYLLPPKIQFLKDVDFLQLSFDGPKEVHDFQRYEGGYEDFILAMKMAKAERINFHTLTVLTKNNINSIDFILNLARKNKFYSFFQPLSKTYFLETSSPGLKLTDDELRAAMRRIIKLKKNNEYIGNSLSGLNFFLKGDKRCRCFAGKYFAYVHTNGDVYPCWVPPNNIKVLNCREVGFKEAFYKMPNFTCLHCLSASTVELNYISSLNLNALFNMFLIKVAK